MQRELKNHMDLLYPLNHFICRLSFIGLPVMGIALWITARVEDADHR
jgi:hypothetical protein